MEVEFMLIADAVEAVNGKLYIMGGCWDRHTANAYPATVKLGQAVALKASLADTGHRKVGFKIVDDSETPVVPEVFADLDLGTGRTGRVILCVNWVVQLVHSGRYQVEVRVGDEVSDSVSFESNIALSN